MTATELHTPLPLRAGPVDLSPSRWCGLANLHNLVSRPVDIASLAAFRFLFGIITAAAMVRFVAKGWVRELYLEPAFFFSYPGLEWIRPWPGLLMYGHFILLALFAIGVALGWFYRVCIVLFFVGFTYVELIDQTAYLNHYYLISLLAGLLVFLPANRAWSIDAWRKPEIRLGAAPAWTLNILRFQIAVVYVFAGLAKLNGDWLFRAQPLRIWLAARSELPLIGHWLEQAWVAVCASWFGAAFDCSIVFLLLSRRTRKPAFVLVILFHVATWILFNIGMFPWIMIIAATLLFPPDWPRHWLSRFCGYGGRYFRVQEWQRCMQEALTKQSPQGALPGQLKPVVVSALLLYAVIQLALPLRSYFVSQPSAWTCSGFNCAWRVMIAEKTGYAEFYAFNPASGEHRKVSVKGYITPRQELLMAQDPYLIQAMARRLAADLNNRGAAPIQVRVVAFATLNGRPSQLLINPDVDLAGIPPPGWIEALAQ